MSTCSRFLNLQPSYTIDLNKQQEQQLYDHDQVVLHHHEMTPPVSFSSLEPRCSSSSSSLPPIYSNPVQDQIGYLYMGSQLHQTPYQHEVEIFGSYESGLYDQTSLEINKDVNHTNLNITICKKDERNLDGGNGGVSDSGAEMNGSSVKWMPLRIMKKIMRAEENQKNQVPPVPVKLETRDLISKTLIGKSHITSNNNDNNTIRVCSDCNTTKTPLWRSGPKGPKSLCNACGIRQRKARRAMALATNGSILPSNMSSSMMRTVNSHKKAPNNNNGFGTQKRRSKVVKPSRDHHHRKICFEEFALNLSKKLSLQQVFPQEEKEAAILLMALSCGFIHE